MNRKILFALGLVAILAAGCAVDVASPADTDAARNAWGTGAVKLARAWAYQHVVHSSPSWERGWEVRVKNLAYTKTVAIHHQLEDGTWVDVPCAYSRPADAGYEIWTATSMKFLMDPQFGPRFCVKAVMNGVTYWDNNGGADFQLDADDGVLLGSGIRVLQNRAWRNGATGASGDLDVRNLAYAKTVQIVWTKDNFATQSVVNAKFVSGYAYGYAYAYSPNTAGTERWTFTFVPATTAALKYYVRYTVNGVTYYDNNFGANYSL